MAATDQIATLARYRGIGRNRPVGCGRFAASDDRGARASLPRCALGCKDSARTTTHPMTGRCRRVRCRQLGGLVHNFCVNINAQPGSGDHEVHDLSAGCQYLPTPAHRRALGWHENCGQAVEAAKLYYSDVNGCYYCCRVCHTS